MAATLADAIFGARAFLRVSYDKSKRERSNDEQNADNLRAFPDFTWGEPYRETGSASRYANKARDDWPKLIADLKAGRFGARHLVLWESSRGSRQVEEWCELIKVCEARGVLIAVTEHHRIYDPTNPRDRRSLLEDAVDSAYESDKTSGRTKRSAAAGAQAGRPHGRPPYGYKRDYDPATGKLLGQVIDPERAPIILELFERVAAGHSLKSITADFKARGIVNGSGKPFTAPHLRVTLSIHAYAGKRVHTPGRKRGGNTPNPTHVVDAEWEPIISERLWLAVQRVISDPSRKTNRGGRARHLLTMIARCDVCSGPLSSVDHGDRPNLTCRDKGCVRIDRPSLDAYAEAAMLGFLSRPDNVERFLAEDDKSEAIEAARLDVARIQAELDELYDEAGAGRLSPGAVARMEPQIVARLKAAQDHAAELSTPSKLRALMKPGEDVAERWTTAPIEVKRTVARMLLTPEALGELRVTRSPKPGHRVPVRERVVWRTAKTSAA